MTPGISDVRSEPFDVFVRRIAPDYADLILAEVERIADQRRILKAEVERLREAMGEAHDEIQTNRVEDALQILLNALDGTAPTSHPDP